MSITTEMFAKECREEVKYYRGRAANAKQKGLSLNRRTMIQCALINRQNARKWSEQ